MRNYGKYSECKKAVSVLLSFFILLQSCNNDIRQYDMKNINNTKKTETVNPSIEMQGMNGEVLSNSINSIEINIFADHNSLENKNEKKKSCCNIPIIGLVISGLLLIIAIIGLGISLSKEIKQNNNLSASVANITDLYDQSEANNTILRAQVIQLNQTLANRLPATQSNVFLNNLNSVFGSENVTLTLNLDPSK